MVQACTKSQQSIQKNYVSEFPILPALKSPLCGLVVFVDMNTYILIEGKNFKTFLQENDVIAMDHSMYFLAKVNLNKPTGA